MGFEFDVLPPGDEPVGVAVDGVPVVGGGGVGSVAISRPKIGGRITFDAGNALGLAGERVGVVCTSVIGDGETAWMAADGAREGSAKSPSPLAALE